MNREPIKIVGDIIKEIMGLSDQQIFIYNQDFKLPQTSGLFVVIQYNTSQIYSSTNEFEPTDVGANEILVTQTREDYTINVMSKDDTARTRKEEVILSLNSNYSRNQQELYQFKIGRVTGNFTNVSELEGAGFYNRFALPISLLAHYSKTVSTPYYDIFTNSIETN